MRKNNEFEKSEFEVLLTQRPAIASASPLRPRPAPIQAAGAALRLRWKGKEREGGEGVDGASVSARCHMTGRLSLAVH